MAANRITTDDNLGIEEQISQETGLRDDSIVSQPVGIRIVQNVRLVWLCNRIDGNITDDANTITQLRNITNTINMFTDIDECIDFITDICDEKVLLIISVRECQNLVSLIHNIAQIHTILIFYAEEKADDQWPEEWFKTRGPFTQISLVIETLKAAIQQCERNAIPVSFMTINSDASKTNLEQLDCSFMYTQILKEILLTIRFDHQHITKFIDYCCESCDKNESELNKFKLFEKIYRTQTPIWWYTCESFLYGTLNKALRLMDVNIMIKMGFFINDLHHHIEELHREQFGAEEPREKFTVYRGQGISKTDFEQMKKTKGGLIAFNNFLSTTKDFCVSRAFAESNQTNLDLVAILFVMTIDPSESTTPFASITSVSQYQENESEVLFSMHTVFRIQDMNPMDENHRVFRVDLTLTSDSDKDLCGVADRIRKEIPPLTDGWNRLGVLLLMMGESEKAEKVYEVLLEQETSFLEKPRIYNQLGCVKLHQGKYDEAMKLFVNASEICNNVLPDDDPNVITCNTNIGNAYYSTGEYSKALSYYENALEIQKRSLSANDPSLATLYNNIGNVYNSMGKYTEALSYHQHSLKIRQLSLPPMHPSLVSSYGNVAMIYYKMNEYSMALSYYEKASEIYEKILPVNHPEMVNTYNNIANVYNTMGEYEKALPYYEKVIRIRRQLLSPNHPSLANGYNNLGALQYNMKNYRKAIICFEKALEMKQISLPPNHPSIAKSYNNIGSLCGQIGEYEKALLYFRKALDIEQISLDPYHPDLATSYNNIGAVNENMGEYLEARSFYERAVETGERTLPPNHSILRTFKMNLNRVNTRISFSIS